MVEKEEKVTKAVPKTQKQAPPKSKIDWDAIGAEIENALKDVGDKKRYTDAVKYTHNIISKLVTAEVVNKLVRPKYTKK